MLVRERWKGDDSSNTMLEEQLAFYLEKYLGNYVKGLSKEALKVSVWQGKHYLLLFSCILSNSWRSAHGLNFYFVALPQSKRIQRVPILLMGLVGVWEITCEHVSVDEHEPMSKEPLTISCFL